MASRVVMREDERRAAIIIAICVALAVLTMMMGCGGDSALQQLR